MAGDRSIRGRVVSGEGVAASFTQLGWVQQQLQERLGFAPHPGTLNLRIEHEADAESLDRLRAEPGIALEAQPGFCAARCYRARLPGGLRAAIVVPTVAGYPGDVLELLAPVSLRKALQLTDGCELVVEV